MTINVTIQDKTMQYFRGCAVYSTNFDDPYDGMVGLTPIADTYSDHFMNVLYSSGIITDKIFSTKYETDDIDSYIYFGGYESFSTKKELIWHRVINDGYWTLDLDVVYFENEPDVQNFNN